MKQVKRAARPKRNPKSTLVEPFKQIKFGLYVISISIAFLCIAAWLFVSAFTQQYQHVMEIFSVVDPNQQWALVTNDVFYSNAKKLGLLFFAYLAILFTVVFRMTHRYYGPLVSIERFVHQMIDGDYRRRVVIRKGDELQKLANLLNTMAAVLEKKHPDAAAKFDRRSGNRDENEDEE